MFKPSFQSSCDSRMTAGLAKPTMSAKKTETFWTTLGSNRLTTPFVGKQTPYAPVHDQDTCNAAQWSEAHSGRVWTSQQNFTRHAV